MGVTTTQTNKPFNPRGNDQSPLAFNRAKLYSGKALDFDGTNDNVEVADNASLDFTTAMSAFCYARVDSTSTSGHLFSKYDYGTNQRSWTIQQDSGNLRVIVSVNGFSGTNTKDYYSATFENTSDYYFVGFTFANNVLKLYVNGQEVTPTKNNDVEITTIFSGSAKVAVGSIQNSGAGASFFDGKIANARAFNTALTAAQVADLYNNPEKVVPTGLESNLKLWLPMMEGAGTTAYDGSGNGNHGTISGATYVNGIGAPVAQSAVMDWNKSSNYIDKSEEFESSYWTENRLVTITDDSFTAPDGSATATEIIENTANDSHFLAQTLSVTAGDYFISVYAKKKDYDFIQLSTGGDTSRYANFNISTGATGNASGITDLIIEDAGNGWYRIGGKITTSSTSFNYFVTLIQSDVASRFQTYTGTDKGQYIWGAQATKSSTLQPYLRNIGTSAITDDVLLPQGLTSGRDLLGNLFENVRKQGALNLDGNSWAEVHDNASIDLSDANASFEAWVYHIDTGVVSQYIMNKFDGTTGVRMRTETGNNFGFYASDGTNNIADSGTFSLTANAWNHIVLTTDGTNFKRYIDGALVDTDVAGTALTTFANADSLYIGSEQTNASLAQSRIAQPRIYNRALTAEEVQRNYNAGKNTYTN